MFKKYTRPNQGCMPLSHKTGNERISPKQIIGYGCEVVATGDLINMDPRVSVVMSVYNGARYLREAIDSILAQTFTDHEFIIVDDGSTDSTWEILTGYDDPRIRLVRNKDNIGLVRSLNRGLELARGEYVARMDADDASHPTRFEKQIEYLEAHPDIGVLGTQMQQIDETGRSLAPFQPPLSHGMIAWKTLFECSIAHATVMMRRALLAEVGGYDPSFTHMEDAELWSRLIHVTRFANLPEPLYFRRWHANSICNRHADTQYRVGMVIRHRLFETMLNKKVEQDVVEWFSRSLYSTPTLDQYQIKRVIALLMELYYSLIEEKSLAPDMATAIRMHLAGRVLRLVQLYGERNRIQSLMTFGHALRLSPQVALSSIGSKTLLRVLFGKRLIDAVRHIRRRFSLTRLETFCH